jgi:hypothetical protein
MRSSRVFILLAFLLYTSAFRPTRSLTAKSDRLGSSVYDTQLPKIQWQAKLLNSWNARIAAEPNFANRFTGEIVLGFTLQLLAECQRRGAVGCLREVDYVLAGLLTAVVGKAIACYRSAATQVVGDDPVTKSTRLTNAFFPSKRLGRHVPLGERALAFVVTPAPSLFTCGAMAGFVGYRFFLSLALSLFIYIYISSIHLFFHSLIQSLIHSSIQSTNKINQSINHPIIQSSNHHHQVWAAS